MCFRNTCPGIMSLQTARLMFCFLLVFVSYIKGLQLSMDRTTDGLYCAHLQCLAKINQTENSASFIVGLSVFNVTQTNIQVKLASLSLFTSGLYIDQNKVHVMNATGSVSKYNGDLTLRFLTDIDCMYGSFLCQLDFINDSGQPDMIKKTVTPGNSENCPTFMKQLLEMAAQIKTNFEDTDRQLTEMRTDMETSFNKQLTELRTDMQTMFDRQLTEQRTDMQTMFDRQLTEQRTEMEKIFGGVARIERLLNLSLDTVQNDTPQIPITCLKGMSHRNPREKFLLWGNITALCDTETDSGGWIVIQRRTKGDVDFYRRWNDYKNGFGTPDTDFWIGNDIIHNLTSQGYTDLRIDMEYGGTQRFAHYSNFTIYDKQWNYRLTLGKYDGTAGDALTYHKESRFSTHERDNDNAPDNNCATNLHGAWWYNACRESNLNGPWGVQDYNGIVWYPGGICFYPTFTEMKIRKV